MSKRIGRLIIIAPEPDAVCELCGKLAELRPYGPKGERICIDCATSTPEMEAAAKRQMDRVLFGEDVH